MSCCGLGVNAFRPSVQIAARQLSRSSFGLSLASLPPARCLSSRSSTTWQPWRPPQKYGQDAVKAFRALVLYSRTPFMLQYPGIRTIFSGHRVITHYVDIPPTYTDRDGLPFARRDMEAHEVITLFGPSMSTVAANQLLRILHGRRVAGTLEDPNLQINTAHFSKKQQAIALDYLRKHVPVDEVVNAGLRAEDELAALENVGAEEAGASSDPGYTTRLKLYKDLDPKDKKSLYGESQFDAIRAKNQAKWEAKRKQQEEERRKREEEERRARPGPLQTIDGQPQRMIGKIRLPEPTPAMQEYIAKATSDLKEPPKMPAWKRILPSAVFALVLSGALVAYSEFYQPLKPTERLFPGVPPAAATVGSLILLNVVGWFLWKIPPIWPFLNRYFLVDVAVPRAPTVLSSLFSHQYLRHLVPNMIFLWILGTRLYDDAGRGTFLATYVSSGMIGSVGTLTWAVLTKRLGTTTLGASGGVYGVMGAYLWMHRLDTFKILGLPPPPSEGFHGITLLALAVALQLPMLFSKKTVLTDLTAHLVGLSVGIAAAHLLEMKREAQRKLQEKSAQGDGIARALPVAKE